MKETKIAEQILLLLLLSSGLAAAYEYHMPV